MGLDLTLYGIKNFNFAKLREAMNQDKTRTILTPEARIWQSRKTWSMYYLLRGACYEYDWCYAISEARWDRFMAIVESAMERNGGYEEIKAAIEDYSSWQNDPERSYDDAKAHESYELLENFVKSVTDQTPVLGYPEEASAILNWYSQDENVQAAFTDGKDLVLVAEY